VYVSQDGKTWGSPAAKGTLVPTPDEKTLLFDRPREARYVRFVATEGFQRQRFASVAELGIIPGE
ncbi:MAG: discoidin domain-containing protein, partial [Thermoguttaceae bacterium]